MLKGALTCYSLQLCVTVSTCSKFSDILKDEVLNSSLYSDWIVYCCDDVLLIKLILKQVPKVQTLNSNVMQGL